MTTSGDVLGTFNKSPDKDQLRFLTYVNKDDNGCWRWTGSKAITGYCNFFYKGRTWLAHRASMVLFKKLTTFTAGRQISHICRNRDCVCPEHLEEKTKEQNNGEDKVRDGVDNGGARCHFSKLTKEAVEDIRASDKSLKELSEFYDVSRSCISSILKNKTWKNM